MKDETEQLQMALGAGTTLPSPRRTGRPRGPRSHAAWFKPCPVCGETISKVVKNPQTKDLQNAITCGRWDCRKAMPGFGESRPSPLRGLPSPTRGIRRAPDWAELSEKRCPGCDVKLAELWPAAEPGAIRNAKSCGRVNCKKTGKRIDWSTQPLGIESDFVIATRLGVKRDTVRNVRIVRGIPSAPGKTGESKLNGVDDLYAIINPDTRQVKIGRGLSPPSRLKDLRSASGNPNLILAAVIHTCGHKERRLHELNEKHRLHGEWFDSTVLEAIFGASLERNDDAFARWVDATWIESDGGPKWQGPKPPRKHKPIPTVPCAQCGEPARAYPSDTRGTQRFCSKRCFGLHKSETGRAAWPTNCAWCSKPLVQGRKRRAHCNRECSQEANGHREQVKAAVVGP